MTPRPEPNRWPGPCGVQWTERDGDCRYCLWPKARHARPGRVFRCAFPDCSYQMWDANFDDANAHWLTHAPAAPAAPALDPERLAKAMWAALSDQGTLRIDADEGKELADIAASVAVAYARLANPEKQ